jgi:hypothetical protein
VQHEVVMVAHQAIGQYLRVEAFQCQRHDVQLRGPVVVVGVDGLAPVATRRHVVDGAGKLDAKRAGRAGLKRGGEQEARPDPSLLSSLPAAAGPKSAPIAIAPS